MLKVQFMKLLVMAYSLFFLIISCCTYKIVTITLLLILYLVKIVVRPYDKRKFNSQIMSINKKYKWINQHKFLQAQYFDLFFTFLCRFYLKELMGDEERQLPSDVVIKYIKFMLTFFRINKKTCNVWRNMFRRRVIIVSLFP